MNEREFLKLIKTSEGCSNWPHGTTADGYGSVRFQGRTWRANRLAYILTKGEIPDNLGVLHKCDNKLCINPEHLYLGDQKDNVKDALYSGNKFGTAKLSKQFVIDILKSHYNDNVNGMRLSERYNVSFVAIYEILKGNHYSDILWEVHSELKACRKLDRIISRIYTKERATNSI